MSGPTTSCAACGERSPWRTFVATSVGVHLGALALVALAAAAAGLAAQGPAQGRGRAVQVSLWAAETPVAEPVAEPPARALEPAPGGERTGRAEARGGAPVVGVAAGGRPEAEASPSEPSRSRAVPSRPAAGPRVETSEPRGGTGGGGEPFPLAAALAPAGELPVPGVEVVEAGVGAGGAPGMESAEPGEGGAETPGVPLVMGTPGSPTLVYLSNPDPRMSDYLGTVARLLEPEWRHAFPRERALWMQQGEVVIEWIVDRDGSVRDLTVLRPSGVPPFDRNVVAGFRRAAERFPRPPASMPLPLRIRAPYRFRNPMFD